MVYLLCMVKEVFQEQSKNGLLILCLNGLIVSIDLLQQQVLLKKSKHYCRKKY
jgi:hypothetical protein